MSPTPWPKPPVTPKKSRKRLTAKHGSLFPERRDREYTRWVRTANSCLIHRRLVGERVSPRDMNRGPWADSAQPIGYIHVCWGPREAAHVGKHVATGAPDFGAVVCLCRAAHRFYDEHRSDWLAVTGFSAADMASAAGGLALRYVERGGAAPAAPPEER